MDERDEIQQERDIAEGWRKKYLEAWDKYLEVQAELAELQAKQIYSGWGKKDE